MIPESDLVPYQASPLPPGPWLVFAPHPDDETLGMGGTILLAKGQKIPVLVVVLTDGARGGNADDDQLAQQRREEAELAGEYLGIETIRFWNEPDRNLKPTESLIQRVADTIKEFHPQTVFFPSPFEIHPDHRTVAQLVWKGLQRYDFQGRAYAYEIAVQSPINRLIDTTAINSQKLDAVRLYASQLSQLDYLTFVDALDTTRSLTLPPDVERAEGFQEFTVFDVELTTHVHNCVQPYCQPTIGADSTRVSVIVRTKDRPGLLKQALSSLAAQHYAHLEIVVVNDGGQNVENLIEGFRPHFDQMHYRNLPQNIGRAGAANIGLETITGDHVMFLDDDDTIDPDHIQKLHASLAENEGFLLAYSGVRVEGKTEVYNRPYDPHLLKAVNFIPIHAVLFSKVLVDKGCRFDPDLVVYEDWDFLLQAACHTTFLHLNHVSATYGNQGSSDISIFNHSDAMVEEYRAKVIAKWRPKWSTSDLDRILRTLMQLNTQKKQALERLSQEQESLNNTLSQLKIEKTQALERLSQEQESLKKTLEECHARYEQSLDERRVRHEQTLEENRVRNEHTFAERQLRINDLKQQGEERRVLYEQTLEEHRVRYDQTLEEHRVRHERTLSERQLKINALKQDVDELTTSNRCFRQWLKLINKDFAALLGSRRWRIGDLIARWLNIIRLRPNRRNAADPILELLEDFNRSETETRRKP